MSHLKRVVVAAIGVAFSTVGLVSVAALAVVLIGAQLLPDGAEAPGRTLIAAATALAAAAGVFCCAAVLRWRREPPPRRASFVELAGGAGRHAKSD